MWWASHSILMFKSINGDKANSHWCYAQKAVWRWRNKIMDLVAIKILNLFHFIINSIPHFFPHPIQKFQIFTWISHSTNIFTFP